MELIKQLALQAHQETLDVYRERMKTEFAGDVIFSDMYDQRFAELLVKECVRSVGSQADKTNLRKLFGVEEPSNIQYPPGDSVEYMKSQYNRKLNLPEDIIGTI